MKQPFAHRHKFAYLVAQNLITACVCICALAPANASAQNAQVPATRTTGDTAVLKAGDKIRINIFREPELSKEVVIPTSGTVSFGKVGDVVVAGMSPDSLKSLLTRRYAASLRDPSIELTPFRRVVVRGAVKQPGTFYADPQMTISSVLAMAGGPTSDGNTKIVEILRNNRRIRITETESLLSEQSALQSGDEIIVPERSWASRNVAIIASAVTGVALVIATVIR